MTKIWGLSKRDAEYGPAPTPSCKEFVPKHPTRTGTESSTDV